MSAYNLRQFNSACKRIVRNAGSVASDVQDALRFAIAHAMQHGDCGYLTRLRESVHAARGLANYKFDGTISAYVDGVSWGELKDGSEGYRKSKKRVECDLDKLPQWDEFERPGSKKAAAEWSIENALKRLAKTAIKKGKAGGATDFQRQVETIMHDADFAAIFADAGVTVETAE